MLNPSHTIQNKTLLAKKFGIPVAKGPKKIERQVGGKESLTNAKHKVVKKVSRPTRMLPK